MPEGGGKVERSLLISSCRHRPKWRGKVSRVSGERGVKGEGPVIKTKRGRGACQILFTGFFRGVKSQGDVRLCEGNGACG